MIKAFYVTFLLTFMRHVHLSGCTEGCLACTHASPDQPVCQVCDVYNHYRLLTNGKCFKYEIGNCQIPSSDPGEKACFLCEPGHFLDNLGKRCSPVPEKHLLPNCVRYHWEYSCTECEPGFYLGQKMCLPVVSAIEHCRHYLDAKNCGQCEDGFFYHVGTKRCEALTERDQCLVYSSVESSRCQGGILKLKMGYLTSGLIEVSFRV